MKKALFLDRDGVINIEKEYLYKIEDFEFIDGIFELCKYYQDAGYLIIVVTNQSGIARGFYSQEQFLELNDWMKNSFAQKGIIVSEVYFCPHHPNITGECRCRKPNDGMIQDAKKDLNIDLENSILVGDKQRDIDAAHKAGIKETYLFDPFEEVTKTDARYKIKSLYEAMK